MSPLDLIDRLYVNWHNRFYIFDFVFRTRYDLIDRDYFGGILGNLYAIRQHYPEFVMRLYYQVPSSQSQFIKVVCPHVCGPSGANFDICNIEDIPNLGILIEIGICKVLS